MAREGPIPPEHLLVLNAGSSSLKFCLYARSGAGPWAAAVRGRFEGLATQPRLRAWDHAGAAIGTDEAGAGVRDAATAVHALAGWLDRRPGHGRIRAVGHRVVHGGALRDGPALVTPALLRELRDLVPLAPLHQPDNLAVIDAAADRLPGVPQVACFDTSFHRGWPAVAGLVPLPAAIREQGVRRYGFHGLSCEYVAGALPRVAPAIAGGRVVVAHLGNGASLCALRAGRSVDSTFGFTALDGLCMGTRPGALDPGVVLHLFGQLGLSARQVESLLYRESGLLGLSGTSGDMRDLLASAAPAARLAVDYFVYRAARELGGLAAVLGGLDGIVFTAGIGENSAEVRARICAAGAWLGLELDAHANAAGGPCISRPGSRVSAWVIPTDEELVIARHAAGVAGVGGDFA